MLKTSEEWLAEAIVTVVWRHAQHNYEGHLFIGSFAPVGLEGFAEHVRTEAQTLIPSMIEEYRMVPDENETSPCLYEDIDAELVARLAFTQIGRMLIAFCAILQKNKSQDSIPLNIP